MWKRGVSDSVDNVVRLPNNDIKNIDALGWMWKC